MLHASYRWETGGLKFAGGFIDSVMIKQSWHKGKSVNFNISVVSMHVEISKVWGKVCKKHMFSNLSKKFQN